ncbi:hypothetical protein FKM82_000755 [Ascaphus truei]
MLLQLGFCLSQNMNIYSLRHPQSLSFITSPRFTNPSLPHLDALLFQESILSLLICLHILIFTCNHLSHHFRLTLKTPLWFYRFWIILSGMIVVD